MDERRRTTLKRHQQALVLKNILPALHTVLTDIEYSRTEDREGNVERVDELINILLTKEDKHFEEFCTALADNGYEHWAKKLRKEVEEGKLAWSDIIGVSRSYIIYAHVLWKAFASVPCMVRCRKPTKYNSPLSAALWWAFPDGKRTYEVREGVSGHIKLAQHFASSFPLAAV